MKNNFYSKTLNLRRSDQIEYIDYEVDKKSLYLEKDEIRTVNNSHLLQMMATLFLKRELSAKNKCLLLGYIVSVINLSRSKDPPTFQ